MKLSSLFSAYILGGIVTYMSFLGVARYSLVIVSAILLSLMSIVNGVAISRGLRGAFLIFFCCVVISFLFNPSISSFVYSVSFLINMLALSYLPKLDIKKKQYVFILILAVLVCLYPEFDEFSGGLTSVFGNANTLALALMLPFYLIFYVRNEVSIWFFVATLSLIIMLMFLTNSRSQYVFIVVFFCMLCLSRVVGLKFLKLVGIVGVLSGFSAYLFLMQGWCSDFFSVVLSGTEKGINLTGRDNLFNIVVSKILNTPTGVGFGGGNSFIESVTGNSLSPHNAVLKIGLEGGVVFLFGFILIYGYLFFNCKKSLTVCFASAYAVKLLFESAMPFTFSLVSILLLLPFFLEKNSATRRRLSHGFIVPSGEKNRG